MGVDIGEVSGRDEHGVGRDAAKGRHVRRRLAVAQEVQAQLHKHATGRRAGRPFGIRKRPFASGLSPCSMHKGAEVAADRDQVQLLAQLRLEAGNGLAGAEPGHGDVQDLRPGLAGYRRRRGQRGCDLGLSVRQGIGAGHCRHQRARRLGSSGIRRNAGDEGGSKNSGRQRKQHGATGDGRHGGPRRWPTRERGPVRSGELAPGVLKHRGRCGPPGDGPSGRGRVWAGRGRRWGRHRPARGRRLWSSQSVPGWLAAVRMSAKGPHPGQDHSVLP